MKTEKIVKTLSVVTAAFVLILAVGGFVLSYNALQAVAAANGIPEMLSYIWPLLIDAAIAVFSAAVLRASLLREPERRIWAMVGLFIVLTMAFNLVHAADGEAITGVTIAGYRLELRYFVGIVPPLAFVLAFETFMAMVRNGVKRTSIMESMADLRTKLTEVETESARLLDKLETERANYRTTLETLKDQFETESAELWTRLEERRTENEIAEAKLETESARLLDKLETERANYRTTLETLKDQFETEAAGLRANGRTIIIPSDTPPADMGPAERQPLIAKLLAAGVGDEDIMRTFGISAKTLKRDIASLPQN